MLILFSLSSYCQTKAVEENYYLHKSKNQKTTGYVLLGSGAALIITAGIIHGKSVKANGAFLNFDGLGFEALGLLSMLSSIPFFAWSSKNKRKNILITFVNQKNSIVTPGPIAFKTTPFLVLKVHL